MHPILVDLYRICLRLRLNVFKNTVTELQEKTVIVSFRCDAVLLHITVTTIKD